MITGKMYQRGGKEKLEDKIIWLQKVYDLNKRKGILYVCINRADAESEGLIDGDYVRNLKIRLSDSVLSNHFWFIEENKHRIRPKFLEWKK